MCDVQHAHPLRVAIDGPDAAGKTTLADELAETLRRAGRPVIRAGVDDFERPRRERHRRSRFSPDGYYEDAFDLAALRSSLLDPLGPGGSRRYRRRAFDLAADRPVRSPAVLAPADAVVIVDGVFLLRPELRAAWELAIFVWVPLDEVERRGVTRDGETAAELYARRYIPAQRRYLRDARPLEVADIVVHNRDPARPVLEVRGTRNALP